MFILKSVFMNFYFKFRVNRSREKILSRENSVENGTPVPSNIHKSVIATTGRKVSENSIILRNPFEKPRHLEFPLIYETVYLRCALSFTNRSKRNALSSPLYTYAYI